MSNFLKIEQWWGSKITPLLTFAFLGIYHFSADMSFLSAFIHLVLFIIGCFGMAGFGHLFLDYFDQQEDRVNNKLNGWSSLGQAKGMLLVSFLFFISWLPFYFLPNWENVRWMLSAEFLLFIIYALPPLRCKERGILGIIIDGLYGYVMPSLVAWTIFAPESKSGWNPIYLFCMLVWLLPKGMRHILRHQYYDIDSDQRAGIGTFAVRYGRSVTLNVINKYLLPIEMSATWIAMLLLSWPSVMPVIGFVIFFAWEWRVLRYQWLQPVPVPSLWKPIERSEWLGMRFLTTFTELLLPLISLWVMLIRHPTLWPMIFVYIMISGRSLKLWWDEVSPLVLKRFIDAKL